NFTHPYEGNDARQVRIMERGRPGRIRRKKSDENPIDVRAVTRMCASPPDMLSPRRIQRLAIRRRRTREACVDIRRWMEGSKDIRGTAHVIRMRMRQNKHVQLAAAAADVGKHD